RGADPEGLDRAPHGRDRFALVRHARDAAGRSECAAVRSVGADAPESWLRARTADSAGDARSLLRQLAPPGAAAEGPASATPDARLGAGGPRSLARRGAVAPERGPAQRPPDPPRVSPRAVPPRAACARRPAPADGGRPRAARLELEDPRRLQPARPLPVRERVQRRALVRPELRRPDGKSRAHARRPAALADRAPHRREAPRSRSRDSGLHGDRPPLAAAGRARARVVAGRALRADGHDALVDVEHLTRDVRVPVNALGVLAA